MSRLFSRFSLTVQIGLIGAIGILGILALAAVLTLGSSRQERHQEAGDTAVRLRNAVAELDSSLLEARRAEKDFLLHKRENEIARHGEMSRAASESLAAVEAVLAQRPELDKLQAKAQTIRERLDHYLRAFRALVAMERQLGLDEASGLRGALRKSVEAIETRLADIDELILKNLMLAMRGHEREFVLQPSQRSLEAMKKLAAEFNAALPSAPIAPRMRTEVAQRMADYQRDFAAYVEGRTLAEEAEKALSEAYAALDPIFDELAAAANERFAAAQRELAESRLATTRLMWSAIAVVLLLTAMAAFVVARAIAKPLVSMTEAMRRLAENDNTVRVPGQGRRDEIGQMAKAVEVFKQNALERQRLEEEAKLRDAAATAEKRRIMADLAAAFDAKVGGLVASLEAAATEMEATARSMSATAEQTNQQALAVASSAEQTAGNVQTVASAAEELSVSSQEIGARVSESARCVARAVEEARRTDGTVRTLAEGAERIGEVIQLISQIAAQTNLLALNATIEAARAGEAGKGFAVVASEVKNLASQTAKATDEIAAQIAQIQNATTGAVQAIQGIGATIEEVNGIASSIAAAVEEQLAATQEIARNIHEASRGTHQVTDRIGQVRDAATHTGGAAQQVLASAGELSRGAQLLSREVTAFLNEVRAA